MDGSASVSAGMDLFGGMRNLHSLRRSELNLEATLLSIEKAKNDLALNVTAAYLDVLFAEERVMIADAHIKTLQMQVEQSQQMVDAGKSTMSDLLQIQSQLADAEYQRISTRNQRQLAYFSLCQLLEIDDYADFSVITPESLTIDTAVALPSTDNVMNAAQDLPQIGRAKLDVEIADRSVRFARSSYYPTLSLSAGYSTSVSERMIKEMNFNSQFRNNAGGSVSLRLSIPIFNSLSTRNNVKAQKIAYRAAEYDMLLAQKQLNREVQQAFIDATGAAEQYNSATQNVSTNEESFRIMEQRYNLGAASPVDYSMALYNLINARSQLAQAKYQYIFKTKILDFYMGSPIELTMEN
jgi:outer membrane protein